MTYFFQKVYGLCVVQSEGGIQLATVDADSAAGAGINLDFAKGVKCFSLADPPIFEENIDYFCGYMHIPGER